MDNLYLIARIANTRVALRSRAIESVVPLGEAIDVPGAPPHVAGLFALRSRVLTLIDPHVVLGLARSTMTARQKVIILEIAGHGYALLADEVEDVCFIESPEEPAKGRLSGGWSRLAEAVIQHDNAVLLVVDPVRLVNAPMQRAA